MAGVVWRWTTECGGVVVVTVQKSGVSHAESGEPRGHTLRLFVYTTVASFLAVVVVVFADMAIGGVHQ
ncbi:hypothetical protein ABIA31_004208 [Catenulispora sp. MAP5-51]|uniref:hypothetical protein n=1 Tax=Catenulispora sp. MAP5-51 TaxID=3156298 RepID=UPI003510ECDB